MAFFAILEKFVCRPALDRCMQAECKKILIYWRSPWGRNTEDRWLMYSPDNRIFG